MGWRNSKGQKSVLWEVSVWISFDSERISFLGLGGDGGPRPKFPARKIFASPSPGKIYSLPAGFPVPEILNFDYKTYLNTICMK